MTHRTKLEQFEAIAQRMVEGSLGRLFGGRLDPAEISAELAHAIDDNQQHGFAPNQYVIALNENDKTSIEQTWPDVVVTLGESIQQMAAQWHLKLVEQPLVTLIVQPNLPRRAIHIAATHVVPKENTTQMMVAISPDDSAALLQQLDAFLIIGGQEHLPLDRPNVTIGRHSDCDIRLLEKTVSRHHAHIRWRFGRFVLHDLASAGGTFVNDQAITEMVLRHGDIIQLANVRLIYGEGRTETQSRPAPRMNENLTRPFAPTDPD